MRGLGWGTQKTWAPTILRDYVSPVSTRLAGLRPFELEEAGKLCLVLLSISKSNPKPSGRARPPSHLEAGVWERAGQPQGLLCKTL